MTSHRWQDVAGEAVGSWRRRGWGATGAERSSALPGDELLPRVDLTVTRAITMAVTPDAVWPWIAQLGQGRGGFYSYDVLENLMGCRIHSANQIVPEWQAPAVGDTVNLYPEGGLLVARMAPGRALVLRGGLPMGRTAPPFDFSWAFVLQDAAEGTARLVVRERYAYSRRWAPLIVRPAALVSAVMSQKMLRGIRDRAERGVTDGAGAAG